MKTAKIEIYLMYGTFNSYACEILYREKVLFGFEGKHLGNLVKGAKDWATTQGFTHFKITMPT